MSVGKSVRLFLADGTPGGLLTAEIMNWTGHVVAAPRSDLGALLKRPEANRTGIYILLGDDPDSMGGTIAYIGEGDDVSKRLYQHSRSEEQGGKDFWDRAILLTSKDANLTKAHARYLESRFISLAQKANRTRLINGTAPAPLPLPESDISDMEYFIAQAKIALPVLGVNLFRNTTMVTESKDASSGGEVVKESVSPVFELRSKKHGFVATAQEIDGEFIVLEGSTARNSWNGVDDGYKSLREKLEQDGTIEISVSGTVAQFTRNHVFASPSAAAAVVTGRSANGRNEWKVAVSGVSFGRWQNQEIEQDLGGDAS
ncbi:GIY-YIG nuclease family protein [Glutamicibacter sp. BW77]|uniref:GIY-YIG nuclease family protein n=1 Tax=Glutamicibacter TaxID=1742989 RepID=UPI000BB802B0|nr:GIY-YIG nuclease family protein [Glutamicibacter sp. BW77]PCC36964.1 endonuclease [Glutamicibacter sp. BW77]